MIGWGRDSTFGGSLVVGIYYISFIKEICILIISIRYERGSLIAL